MKYHPFERVGINSYEGYWGSAAVLEGSADAYGRETYKCYMFNHDRLGWADPVFMAFDFEMFKVDQGILAPGE